MTLLINGYLDKEELLALPGVPSQQRMEKGPVAVIECAQEIPCNPCVDACRYHAITMEGSLTDLPVLNEEDCIGCGTCLAICPGQAIFLVDATYSETEGLVKVPYEYVPLPKVGDIVDGLNRAGKVVCQAEVKMVVNAKINDRTPIVTLIVPKELIMEVRSLKLKG
jgi:Fe-S-cluster-containing hydrogenase component 2